MFGGAELEAEFGPFSAEFGVRDVWAFGAIWHSGPWVERVRGASLWWLRPAGDTLAAEKQIPRDRAARNDKFLFGRDGNPSGQ